MNKQIRNYVSVALVFLIALSALVYALVWLSGALKPRYKLIAIFPDARGIQASEFIYMAGIEIGQVASVDLDETGRRAKMVLDISAKYNIPHGSLFTIKSGLLGNQGSLSIAPSEEKVNLKDGDTVMGDSSDIFGTIAAKAPQTMESAEKTMNEVAVTMKKSQLLLAKFGRLADDMDHTLVGMAGPDGDLHKTLANTSAASAELPRLMSDMHGQLVLLSAQTRQLLAGLQTTEKGAGKVINGAGKLTDNLNGTLNENRAVLRSILRSADDAASAVAGLTDQLKTTVSDPKLKQNLATAADNLVSVTSRLDNSAAGIERLSSDPRMASDIRETVTNLRETSESIRNLAVRAETIHIPGEKRTAASGDSADSSARSTVKPPSFTTLYEPGLVLDSAYDTKVERYRLDTNYTLMYGKNNGFYRLGLYDATEKNRLNLQAGKSLGDFAALRYGVVNGKLGTGLDFGAGPLGFRFDLFDPNNFTVNARGRLYLNPNTAITGGVDSLGHENRATFGITIRK